MDHSREQKIIKQFGERLKEIRTSKKLSTRALADLADMDFGNINEIENGKINPSLTTIVILAEALQIDPDDLFHPKIILEILKINMLQIQLRIVKFHPRARGTTLCA